MWGRQRRPFCCLHNGKGPPDVLPVRIVLVRYGDRPRNREHACLCQGQGDRAERAFRGGLSRQGRPQAGAGGGRGRQADAGPHTRQHRGDSADARGRDRRFRRRRRDDQVLHPQGSPPHDVLETEDHRLRAAWRDAGRETCDPPVGAVGGRAACRADRGTDRGGDRRGHADHRSDRQHGRGHRRRHDRSGGAVPGRYRLCAFGARRRRPDGRGDHQLPAAPAEPSDRRNRRPSGSRPASAPHGCPTTGAAPRCRSAAATC